MDLSISFCINAVETVKTVDPDSAFHIAHGLNRGLGGVCRAHGMDSSISFCTNPVKTVKTVGPDTAFHIAHGLNRGLWFNH